MIVGWLADEGDYVGGAELDAAALQAASQHEIVKMPPGRVGPADLYVISNCVNYHGRELERLADVPIVKIVNDRWLYGHPPFREGILHRASLIVFRSPLHRERFSFDYDCDSFLCPSPVDLARFRQAAGTVERRERAVWVANVLSAQRRRGLESARAWAAGRGIPLDEYGVGTELGSVPYEAIPVLFAGYRWYAHAMGVCEPFGRTTVEAWAAGCHLAVSDNVGALWWIENDPEALEHPAERFWKEVDARCLVSA